MKTINAKQMDEKFCCNDNAVVIDVLPAEYFNKEHIPGAINIPVESRDFLEKVAKTVKGKTQDIAVYCANAQCTASGDAAKKLMAAGYTGVHKFPGGLKEWKDSGHATEGSGGKEGKAECGSCC
ncbi:MAG: rhodanese-like domain-containing protein [Proteobacteria bacterium]|nr:rhodanese-like domain-containing protein [Pseudomonadota bacterium]